MVDLKTDKAIACNLMLKYPVIEIIEYFNNKAKGLLEYYQPAFNYSWIKTQINYRMRRSLLYTMARKHKKSLVEIVKF